MLAHSILYVLMALYVVTILVTVSSVGKPRGPVTPKVATLVSAYALLWVAALAYVSTRL